MQKWILAIVMLASGITSVNAQSYEERAREYITRYRELAMQEQQRSGIPASITLAQGIHETSAGNSELATNANNHFGIKCKKSWKGDTYSYTDDAPNECFRKYESPEQSYIDHSDYLSTSPRYALLFTYSQTDYASWAFGLKKCGYATNPRYAQTLIKLIEEYSLQDYTYAALNNKAGSNIVLQNRQNEIVPEHDAEIIPAAAAPAATPIATTAVTTSGRHGSRIIVNEDASEPAAEEIPEFPPYGEVVRVNNLKAVYAKQGDMPLEYALKTGVRYEKLLEINDISDKPLAEDMYLYLERKNTKGLRPVHVVKEGETIAHVSRFEGMNEKNIRALNKLAFDDEPVAGTILQLQTEAPVKPQVMPKPQVTVAAPTPPATEEQPAIATDETGNIIPTPAEEQPQELTPVEENTLAGNTAAEPVMDIPQPSPAAEEEVAAAETIEKADIGPALPPGAIKKPKPDVAAPEPGTPNPPETINIANEKPIEEVIAEEKKAAAEPQPEEPKDELDILKARFDKVVYADRNKTPAPAAPKPSATPAPEKNTTETPATPTTPSAEPEVKTEPAATVVTSAKFYTVKKGDTAFSIAKRNNITMRQLMDWNNLDFEAIKIGQRLRVQP